MPRRKDSQGGLFDRTIENPDLAASLAYLDDHRMYIKGIAEAQKVIKEAQEALELEDGERVRCGDYIITGKSRRGGGFAVPTWSKITMGSYEPATA